MASDTENAETAAERLEAALERIARLAGGGGTPLDPAAELEVARQLTERLDAMIERLRSALNGPT